MRVGELYHSQEHGLIVIRKVSLTHQSMNGKSLYKIVFLVVTSGRLGYAQMTRDGFHDRFMSL